MKKFQKLNRFPLGKIHAEGFLKEQLLLGKNGMAGHLFKLEPGMIYDPFINKTYVESWGNGSQSGWGAEISGNYWAGYIQHAFVLNDAEMIKTATEWVDTMIKKQRSDGYLGTYYEPDAKIHEDYNGWGTACMMRGLIAFYEATKRQNVLDAVYRCMLWFCENWAGDNKTSYAGAYIIEPMIFCYYYTGDERLVSFCEDYQEYLARNDLYKNSYKTYLYEDFHYFSNHTAGVGTAGRLPALIYTATGKEDYLKATERLIKNLRKKSIQPTGGPVSYVEYLGPKSSTGESEYCSFAFYNAMYSYMSYITGEAKYGDYMEEMFYNATQGARKKDEKAIAYLSQPNQIFATEKSSTAGTEPDMQVYAPCYPVSCCPVNAVAVVPEFIRGMILYDDENNLYMTAYGPVSLETDNVKLQEKTYYPFRHNVSFEIDSKIQRSVFLKIPEWDLDYKIVLNGKTITAEKNKNGYAKVDIIAGNSILEIKFTAEIKIFKVDDSDAAGKLPITIKYGALIYSYHIPEIWEAIKGNPTTPLPDGWSWYNVKPYYKEPDGDLYERPARRRDAYTWNVAIDEDLKPEDIEIEYLDERGYVWENPMIRLHTHCYKAPYLTATYPTLTLEPFKDKQFVTEKIPLVLEPYGCTNLRITYFPRADLSLHNQETNLAKQHI